MRQPRLHRAGHGTGERPPAQDPGREVRVGGGDVAHDEVAVAGHRLGVAADDEVRTQLQGAQRERRRERRVDRQQRARPAGRPRERLDVEDVEGRVARRLGPDDARPLRRLLHDDLVGRDEPDLDAARGEVLVAERPHGAVAVGGTTTTSPGRVSGDEHRRRRRHARREERRRAPLQLAERGLVVREGRVAVAAVAVRGAVDVAGQVERRREHRTWQQGLPGGRRRLSGVDDAGGGTVAVGGHRQDASHPGRNRGPPQGFTLRCARTPSPSRPPSRPSPSQRPSPRPPRPRSPPAAPP